MKLFIHLFIVRIKLDKAFRINRLYKLYCQETDLTYFISFRLLDILNQRNCTTSLAKNNNFILV